MKNVFMVCVLAFSSLASSMALADSERDWSDGISGGYDNDYEKYLEARCYAKNEENATLKRNCFNLNEESAIADAIISTGQDIHTVVMGKNVVLMNDKEYYKWQQVMGNNLAKAGLSTVHLALAVPFKLVTGTVVSVAGLFWSPFEKKGETGDLARKGLGLFVKSLGDVLTDTVGIVDGVTLGAPIYAVTLPFTAASVPVKEVEAGVK